MTAQDTRPDMDTADTDGPSSHASYDYMKNLDPVDLVKTVGADATALMIDEIALAKKEALQALGDLRSSITSIVLAAITLFAGALFLMLSAVFGLARVMPFWEASLYIGGGIFLVGIFMILRARRLASADNLNPRQSSESLSRDKDMLQKHI